MMPTRHERDTRERMPKRTLASVVEQYGLSREEASRMTAMTPGDEVSSYRGFPDIQAQIIVDGRAEGAAPDIGNTATKSLVGIEGGGELQAQPPQVMQEVA